MKKVAFIILLAMIVSLPCPAQAQTPQQTLNQYIADLQKTPNDHALREKIIKHVQMMKPAPAVPEEARRQYVMGKTLFEDAKNVQDFKDAIEKFRKALLIAPWWPEANRDLGMALQAAQEYAEAIRALKLYIATNPGEELSRRAQNEIYKIEAKQEKAAKETSRQAQVAVAPKQNTFEDLLRKIDGRRYTSRDKGLQILLDVRGRTLVQGCIENNGSYRELGRTEIRGREFTEPVHSNIPRDIARIVERYWSISESGESITLRWRWSGGEMEQLIYRWQR